MEVSRPRGPEARADPLAHRLGMRDDLVGEPEERDVGELFEEMFSDRPPQSLPLAGIHSRGPGQVGLLDELVLVVVVRSLAIVADPDPLLRRAPGDDVGPDAATDRLLAEHLPHLGPVEHLDLRLDANILVVDPQGLGHLRTFRLAWFGERQDLELQLPRAVTGLLEARLRLSGVVVVHLVEPTRPLRVVAL